MKPAREEESRRPTEQGWYWYTTTNQAIPSELRVDHMVYVFQSNDKWWLEEYENHEVYEITDKLSGTFTAIPDAATLLRLQASEKQANLVAHIAAKLLELASDTFGNHGCNDFELPNTPESLAFITAMMKEDDDESEPYITKDGSHIITQDSILMSYCARLLKGATTDEQAI